MLQVSTSDNEKALLRNKNLPPDYNMSIIDLGECKKKLKEEYHRRRFFNNIKERIIIW